MHQYKFISTLRYLTIKDQIDDYFTLMPGINLITDPRKISEIIDEEFELIAGLIEKYHFDNANNLLFCEFDETFFKQALNPLQALFVWLGWVDLLIKDSWLLKDNAIVCESAYVKVTNRDKSEWASNYLVSSNTYSSGEKHQEITFNFSELIEWEQKSCQLQSYLHQKNSGVFTSFTDKQFSRIGRALRFISAARREGHPAIKISHYCSALESLFSTDNSEISHKLSERIAIFLKKYGYDPLIVFNEMKSFYTIRSKVTHGDNINDKNINFLPDQSVKCDNYLRYIVNIILEDNNLQNIFDSNKENLENYFRKLVLLG